SSRRFVYVLTGPGLIFLLQRMKESWIVDHISMMWKCYEGLGVFCVGGHFPSLPLSSSTLATNVTLDDVSHLLVLGRSGFTAGDTNFLLAAIKGPHFFLL
ncbi:unnamed protein product, partial [Choristocarpus tenellus]